MTEATEREPAATLSRGRRAVLPGLGGGVLERVQDAQRLFEREERRLLDFLLSNCSRACGEMTATPSQPLGGQMEAIAIVAREGAAAPADSEGNEGWLGDVDSNHDRQSQNLQSYH